MELDDNINKYIEIFEKIIKKINQYLNLKKDLIFPIAFLIICFGNYFGFIFVTNFALFYKTILKEKELFSDLTYLKNYLSIFCGTLLFEQYINNFNYIYCFFKLLFFKYYLTDENSKNIVSYFKHYILKLNEKIFDSNNEKDTHTITDLLDFNDFINSSNKKIK